MRNTGRHGHGEGETIDNHPHDQSRNCQDGIAGSSSVPRVRLDPRTSLAIAAERDMHVQPDRILANSFKNDALTFTKC